MRVLVACEYSATVRDAFRERGHDAYSCDILPTEGDPAYHYEQDVLELATEPWDMMIAHPPCTYLANSGVRWLWHKETGALDLERAEGLIEGHKFFMKLFNADIPRIAIENPIPHKHANLPKHNQVVQPWHFGDNETKAVCLWLKGLPKLELNITEKPDNIVNRVHFMSPSPDRQKERSRFFKGIADAMAEQWGNLLI